MADMVFLMVYFSVKGTVARMSADEAPTKALNLPGSATHACALSSKNFRSSAVIVKVAVAVSPLFRSSLRNPLSSLSGRGSDDFSSAM